MRNNELSPTKYEGNGKDGDPATGQDSTDSTTNDTPKTKIGSGDSDCSEDGRPSKASHLAPDRRIYLVRATGADGPRPIHLEEQCQYVRQTERYRQTVVAAVGDDRPVCKECRGADFRGGSPDLDMACEHCEATFRSYGGYARHVMVEHSTWPATLPSEVGREAGAIATDRQRVMTDGGYKTTVADRLEAAAKQLHLARADLRSGMVTWDAEERQLDSLARAEHLLRGVAQARADQDQPAGEAGMQPGGDRDDL